MTAGLRRHQGEIAFFIAAISLWVSEGSSALQPDGGIKLGLIVPVSTAGENVQQIWAYADPEDGRHLMTCGYFSRPRLNLTHGYVYSSADAGVTWHRTLLDDATAWVTEESCTYGNDGQAYFADGESDTSTGQPRHEWGHLQLFSSTDHGMTWTRGGTRREGWVDWTYLAALPADTDHFASLVVFGNQATDRPGHWWKQHPITLEAANGAGNVSGVTALRSKSLYGVFSGGSVVLPDRTALFIAGSQLNPKDPPAKVRTQLTVFSFSSSHAQLQSRAVLRTGHGRNFLTGPALVRAPDDGLFPGRLYAAWEEHAAAAVPGNDTSELWLGTSDDSGFHWSSRRVFASRDAGAMLCAGSQLNSVRIAVNRLGMLGILWSQRSARVQFARSIDGGQTFQPSQLVAKQEAGPIAVTDAVPWNEWELAEFLAFQQGRPLEPFVDNSHLGLSVRMEESGGVSDIALTADAQNTFHAFWAGADTDGSHVLLTRTIEVTSSTPGTQTALDSAAPIAPCMAETSQIHPALPYRRPSFSVKGQEEVTSSFDLQIGQLQYEPVSRAVTAHVTLINKSNKAVVGPLALFAFGIHSDFGVPVAVNATGVDRGQSFWELSDAMPTEGLPPKAHTRAIELKFRIDRFEPVPASADALAMWVRLYNLSSPRH